MFLMGTRTSSSNTNRQPEYSTIESYAKLIVRIFREGKKLMYKLDYKHPREIKNYEDGGIILQGTQLDQIP